MEALGLLWEWLGVLLGSFWSIWKALGVHFRAFRPTLGQNYVEKCYVLILIFLWSEIITFVGLGQLKWARLEAPELRSVARRGSG